MIGKHHQNFIAQPLIKANTVEYRKYQATIVEKCLKGNTLVVLPTGLGKTIIAAIVAAHRLSKHPDSKCIMLAPTRPLVNQHCEIFKSVLNLPTHEINAITGTVKPQNRTNILNSSKVVLMTPQILENDLIAGRCDLSSVSLIIFDEAHRAIGNYPYVYIAKEYMKQAKYPLILGLTASPGSKREKIEEICKNLYISQIESRTEYSPDVRPYIHPIYIEWKTVKLPPDFLKIKILLEILLKEKLKILKEYGYLESLDTKKISRKNLLELRAKIQSELAEYLRPPSSLFSVSLAIAEALKLSHMLELLETQGITPVADYITRMEREAKRPGHQKATETLLNNDRFPELKKLIQKLVRENYEHPKIKETVNMVSRHLQLNKEARIIVFTKFRNTAKKLVEELSQINGIRPARFVGQVSKDTDAGLTQKEQLKTLEKFKEGIYNVLVATSVAEEGLDIAECDLVICYDTVPSAIRQIQRRGRTGRRRPGRMVILIAEKTRDEAYFWSARHKEKIMKQVIKEISTKLNTINIDTMSTSLDAFKQTQTELMVCVDNRELRSQTAKCLAELGVKLVPEQLTVADYIISDRVAVERKTTEDFLQSIIDKRLFQQLANLKKSYTAPILIIEGENIYKGKAISPDAVRGALASIVLDFGIPILWTKTPSETAHLIYALTKREQIKEKRYPSIKKEKVPLSDKELQEYIVSSLPGIDLTLARRLLKDLKTVENVFTASEDTLKKVKGIGEKTAKKIREILTLSYNDSE
mgnify:CR=1 FL=1